MIIHESSSVRVSIGESNTHILDKLQVTADKVGKISAATGALLILAELHPKSAESPFARRLSKAGRILGAVGTAISASEQLADSMGISRADSETPDDDIDLDEASEGEIDLNELRDELTS